jgi:hypothetical protein
MKCILEENTTQTIISLQYYLEERVLPGSSGKSAADLYRDDPDDNINFAQKWLSDLTLCDANEITCSRQREAIR